MRQGAKRHRRAQQHVGTVTETNDVQTSTGQATQVGRASVGSTLTMTRGARASGRRRRRQRWPMVLTTNAPGDTTIVPTHAACREPTHCHAGAATRQQQLWCHRQRRSTPCASLAALKGPCSAYHSEYAAAHRPAWEKAGAMGPRCAHSGPPAVSKQLLARSARRPRHKRFKSSRPAVPQLVS
jgi:hypothetical protein